MYLSSEIPNRPCQRSRWLMRTGGFVVWDTETTGLEDDSKIVSIGVYRHDGVKLLDSLINPGAPIPEDATAIHGITAAMVADAPTFEQLYPQIRLALINQRWVIYNRAYDVPRLRYECERYGLLFPTPAGEIHTVNGRLPLRVDAVDCAMEMYAEFHGEWNDYHGNYRWQSLKNAAAQCGITTVGAHNAAADALTTLNIIRAMAWSEDRAERN